LAAPMASLIGGNVIIGGTLGTSSRHPCVPLHPGWESRALPFWEMALVFHYYLGIFGLNIYLDLKSKQIKYKT